MTITAQITGVGQLREFSTNQNGLETKKQAVEVRFRSGMSEFLADIYGEDAVALVNKALVGHWAVIDVVFSVKEVDRKDGQGKFACMRGTIQYVMLG